jgi:hypothetical protein
MRISTFSVRSADEARALERADGTQLVLLFGNPNVEAVQPILAAFGERFAGAILAGCSTSGEIMGETIKDGTVSGAVVGFEGTRVASSSAPVASAAGSFDAGVKLARALAAPDLRGVFVLSDGLNVNGSELVRGLSSTLPSDVVVTGGLAGDGDRFGSTWVLHEGAPASRIVTAVGFYGDSIRIGHGSRGGWDIFGPERVVTRSEGNVLYELDGRPALNLYREYLGELASGLPGTALLFPLAIWSAEAPEQQVVRTILAVDEAANTMTFAGDIPQGSRAQLMQANFDRLVSSAGDAAHLTTAGPEDEGPLLAIAISCVGRRLILGGRTEEELTAVLEALPAGSTQVGFYSYGELSPLASGTCDLHNQTMTLTTFRELAA